MRFCETCKNTQNACNFQKLIINYNNLQKYLKYRTFEIRRSQVEVANSTFRNFGNFSEGSIEAYLI